MEARIYENTYTAARRSVVPGLYNWESTPVQNAIGGR